MEGLFVLYRGWGRGKVPRGKKGGRSEQSGAILKGHSRGFYENERRGRGDWEETRGKIEERKGCNHEH